MRQELHRLNDLAWKATLCHLHCHLWLKQLQAHPDLWAGELDSTLDGEVAGLCYQRDYGMGDAVTHLWKIRSHNIPPIFLGRDSRCVLSWVVMGFQVSALRPVQSELPV